MPTTATPDQVMSALQKADAAGNTNDARQLAAMYRQLTTQSVDQLAGTRLSAQDAAAMTHGAQQTPPPEQPIDRIAAMVRGNATENIPSLADPEFAEAGQHSLKNIGLGVAALFGNDENYAQAALRANPGSTLSQDANGNLVVQLANGKRFYVNQPGLDTDDILRGLGKLVPFLPVGGAAAVPTSLLGRIAVGGVGSGLVDAGEQIAGTAAAGNPDIPHPWQTAAAAGIGAASELVPSAASGLYNLWQRAGISGSKAAARGAKIAAEAALPGQLTQADLIALGRRYPEIQGGASPEAALAESEFGFKLTRGQKTGDSRLLRREEMLRSGGGDTMASRAARNVYQQQEQNLAEQAQRIQDYLAGGKSPSSPAEAAQTVIDSVRQQASDLKGQVNAAYNAVRSTNAAVNVGQVQALPQRLAAAVRDYDITPGLTLATYRQLERIQDELSKLPPQTTGVTLRAIETNRKILSNAIGSAANPTDKAALTLVKDAFDDWLDETFDNALISGDPQALETLKQARALRAEYGMRFQPKNSNDQGGKIVQKLLSDQATPDEMAQTIFGAGQLAPQASASVVQKLKAALGGDTDAWNAVRSAFINKAVTNRAGETLGPQAMTNNLVKLLRERPELVKQLYSPDEIAKLQRFATAMKVLIPPKELVNNSRTFDKAVAFFNEYLSSIPGGKTLLNIVTAPRRAATAARLTSPVMPGASRIWPAIINTVGQEGLQEQQQR